MGFPARSPLQVDVCLFGFPLSVARSGYARFAPPSSNEEEEEKFGEETLFNKRWRETGHAT